MRFLFVGSRLCLRLPSDSASRRTPLPSGYRFPPSGSEEDLHLQVTNQAPYLIGWRLRATRHAWRTTKKPHLSDEWWGLLDKIPGGDLLSHTAARAVPSALRGLT